MKHEALKFACMECGHRFGTLRGAERAAFGDKGCPGCGGADIDLDPGPTLKRFRRAGMPYGAFDNA